MEIISTSFYVHHNLYMMFVNLPPADPANPLIQQSKGSLNPACALARKSRSCLTARPLKQRNVGLLEYRNVGRNSLRPDKKEPDRPHYSAIP
jgi:hypothetical protein